MTALLGTGFIRLSKELFAKQQPGPSISGSDQTLKSVALKLGLIQIGLVFAAIAFLPFRPSLATAAALFSILNTVVYWGIAWCAYDAARLARVSLVVCCLISVVISTYFAFRLPAVNPVALVIALYSFVVAAVAIRQLSGGNGDAFT